MATLSLVPQGTTMSQRSRAKKDRRSRAKKDGRRSVTTPSPVNIQQTTARRRTLSTVLPLLLAVGSLTVLAAGYFYLRSTVPISFSANLVSDGDARFSYTTPQQETYSPACGCWEDKSERWRGITFAARQLQIANVTEASHTAFWLMASAPGSLDWRPTTFRPSVRFLQLSVANGKTLRASDLVSPLTSSACLPN
jgi:hypothetical protein